MLCLQEVDVYGKYVSITINISTVADADFVHTKINLSLVDSNPISCSDW